MPKLTKIVGTKTNSGELQTKPMNLSSNNSYRRCKAKKNKENLIHNRIQKDTSRGHPQKSRADLTRLMLKRKPRTRARDAQFAGVQPLLKRYSMQVELEPQIRAPLGEKSKVLKALWKKVGMNYSTHEEGKRSKMRRPEEPRNLKSSDKREMGRGNRAKRKLKTLSSNNFAISRILKNSVKDTQRAENGHRHKPKKKCKTDKQAKENAPDKKTKDALETAKPTKPPLLPKTGQYASYNGGIQRGKLKGFVRRKLSMRVGKGANEIQSKPNSPSGQSRTGFLVSPRYFRTLGKDESHVGGALDFIPAPKLIRSKRSGKRTMGHIQEEQTEQAKADKLRKMLVRRRNAPLTKRGSNQSSSSREMTNGDAFMSRIGQKVSIAELKTPINGEKNETQRSPPKRRGPKGHKKIKNIFSFNKDSIRETDEGEKGSQAMPNNTSLLYSCALNSSRTQNSFIMLKNRMGGGKASLGQLGQSVHFRVDSLKNGSILAKEGHSRVNKSFMQRVRNHAHKKRSKSFFEVDKENISLMNPDFLEGASDNKISNLGLPSLGGMSKSKSQSESDQLSNFIESMQKPQEHENSVRTIREESEISTENRIGSDWKRPPTLEGTRQVRLIRRLRGFFGRIAEGGSIKRSPKSVRTF